MAPRATVRPMIVVFLNSTLSQTPDEHRKKPACIVRYLLPERGQFISGTSISLSRQRQPAPHTALHQPSVL